MPYLIIVLLALGIAAAQAGIGGMKLLYALPACGVIGLAALCSLFEPARRVSAGARARCLGAAILLAGVIVVRGYFSPVDYLARHDLFMTLAALTVYLLCSLFLSAARARFVLIVILLVFAAAHLARGVVQFRGGQDMFFSPTIEREEYPGRASGFYLNPNHLAGLLEMLGVMAVSLACWSNWRLVARMAAGYAALACFIGVVLTGSRGGYVSLLAGLVVFSALSLYVVRRLRPANFWPTLVAVIMLFSAAIGGGGALMSKSHALFNRLEVEMNQSLNSRLTMWDAALKQFAMSPLVGTGSGSYQIHGPRLRVESVARDATHVQNDYLELLCEYGIVGAVALAFFVGIHFWNGLGGIRRILAEVEDVGWGVLNNELALLLGAIPAIAALLAHSLFDSNLHVPGNALVVAFFFSILASPTIETLLPEESAAPTLAVHWLRFLAPVIGLYLLVVGAPRVEGEFYAEYAARAFHSEDYELAARYAVSGIAVEKKNPNLFSLLGESRRLLARVADPDESSIEPTEALEALRAGLALSPHDLRLLLSLGRAYDSQRRFTEARAAFQKAIEADPNSLDAHFEYGRHFEMQGNLGEAEPHYRRAAELEQPGGLASARLREMRVQPRSARPPQP